MAVLDVFKDKLVKRGVSLKTLDPAEPKLSGKEYRMAVALNEGISQDNARKLSKIIRDEGPKGVRAQIQGEELRVSAKKKDDLQTVIPRRASGTATHLADQVIVGQAVLHPERRDLIDVNRVGQGPRRLLGQLCV